MTERTLLLTKPDAIERRLLGEITRRAESKGSEMVAMATKLLSREQREQHCALHRWKAFFEPLMTFMLSGPTIAAVP